MAKTKEELREYQRNWYNKNKKAKATQIAYVLKDNLKGSRTLHKATQQGCDLVGADPSNVTLVGVLVDEVLKSNLSALAKRIINDCLANI